jgi:hypothetical protein
MAIDVVLINVVEQNISRRFTVHGLAEKNSGFVSRTNPLFVKMGAEYLFPSYPWDCEILRVSV